MKRAILTALLVLTSSATGASTLVKFYDGHRGYDGPFAGAGTMYADTEFLATNCPAVGTCRQDNLQNPQRYQGVPDLTAFANGRQFVWDDLAGPLHFAGLGVGRIHNGIFDNFDNIKGSDQLTLHFAEPITLHGVGTLFDSSHGPFGHGNPERDHFRLSVDGGRFHAVSFWDANYDRLDLTGSTFVFEHAKHHGNSFYVSALDYAVVPTPPGPPPVVPAPATLPLLMSGLAALGLLGWRKKTKSIPK